LLSASFASEDTSSTDFRADIEEAVIAIALVVFCVRDTIRPRDTAQAFVRKVGASVAFVITFLAGIASCIIVPVLANAGIQADFSEHVTEAGKAFVLRQGACLTKCVAETAIRCTGIDEPVDALAGSQKGVDRTILA
jgi:predicted cation transporter